MANTKPDVVVAPDGMVAISSEYTFARAAFQSKADQSTARRPNLRPKRWPL